MFDTNEKRPSKEVFLINVQNEFEANLIKGLLQTHNIHTLSKYKEAGDYLKLYMGGTNFGIDIYVMENQLEEAKEIINNQPELDETFESNQNEEDLKHEKEYLRKRKLLFWIAIIIIIIPTLILLLLDFIDKFFY